jgi:hypothetical protein
VAIVIDRILALEAVPAPDPKLDKQSVRLPHTVEVGKWSRAELRGGVRLIPIADLAVFGRKWDQSEKLIFRPVAMSFDGILDGAGV